MTIGDCVGYERAMVVRDVRHHAKKIHFGFTRREAVRSQRAGCDEAREMPCERKGSCTQSTNVPVIFAHLLLHVSLCGPRNFGFSCANEDTVHASRDLRHPTLLDLQMCHSALSDLRRRRIWFGVDSGSEQSRRWSVFTKSPRFKERGLGRTEIYRMQVSDTSRTPEVNFNDRRAITSASTHLRSAGPVRPGPQMEDGSSKSADRRPIAI